MSGYIGFAVGRTLDHVRGRIGPDDAARRIAGNYRRMIEAYVRAARNGR